MTNATTGGLRLEGITKRFGSFTANDAVDLDVRPGEIHCLLGENGAGKSTLMNVLYGLYQPDGGQIVVDGEPRTFSNPKQAMAAGIGMVHQHFMLVDVFTVAENVMLGREGAFVLNKERARARVREIGERYGMPVDPDAVVEDLPVGLQQRVEILKALANDAEILVLDEPTAVLTPQEIDELMGVMTALRDEGKAIVFITHKLREVRAIADRITVMRRGKIVGHAEPGTSEADLAEMMVGRAVDLRVDKAAAEVGDVRLQVSDLRVTNVAGVVVVDGLTFDVRAGEVLCVAGVQGNGQSELADAILGNMPVASGTITLDGRDITRANPHDTIAAGVGFVPEDRQADGFVSSFSIAENLVLNRFDQPPFSRGPALALPQIQDNAERLRQEFDIRTESISAPLSSLSGGNQQKVVLARELSRDLALLVASQPTRGVDVGAIEFLHRRIVEERDTGTAVLLVSTELDEVEALADRVLVMYRGRVVGIVPPETPRDVVGLMMAGVPYEEAVASAENPTPRAEAVATQGAAERGEHA
ncbi:ABC transporter ATP-binding protein [Nigerium massiliense]|uniref:ABC transporter ATP-binding protein n=1 Tax=Nigerium massiliense TaxID=1522317 RepID=UPI0005905B0D|nr:ABC transporter ATP-binding protein [Nigerium massiliense]